MKRIWLALALWSTLFLLVAGGLGLALHGTQAEPWKNYHLQAGVFTAIFVCFVHSLIFIHLLGTGLGIKRAIDEHHLDEAQKKDLHRFKMKAFPPCMGTAVSAIATAVLGGAALNGASPHAHLTLAIVVLVANVLTIPVVVKQLAENEQLLRRVEADVAARSGEVAS